MTGRPLNQDRQNALELGLLTYEGVPHYRCGTTKRYTKGGGCVHCGRLIATEQREARIYLKKMQAALDIPAEDGLETEAQRQARFEESIEDLM